MVHEYIYSMLGVGGVKSMERTRERILEWVRRSALSMLDRWPFSNSVEHGRMRTLPSCKGLSFAHVLWSIAVYLLFHFWSACCIDCCGAQASVCYSLLQYNVSSSEVRGT